jgi:D-alanine-D-alanine ligase
VGGVLRTGLLFGGKSAEHRVSVVSARGVAAGFHRDRIECIPLAVTRSGRWLPPDISRRILEGDAVEVAEPDPAAGSILGRPGGGGLFLSRPGEVALPIQLDVVFPVIHGWGGEDGRIQAFLELAGIPFVGAGVAGSAVAMDKGLARSILERERVPMAPWRCLTAVEIGRAAGRIGEELMVAPGFPLFVKPANGGSSVGISRVEHPGDLASALELALAHDTRVVVEQALDAREIECAVLGNSRPEAAEPGEVVPGAEFYTYDDKYHDGRAKLHIPADLPEDTMNRIRSLALQVFRCLDLSGMARIDFLIDRQSGVVYFNEANTIPGFTPISMYAKLWEAAGLPYPELLNRLVELALERRR